MQQVMQRDELPTFEAVLVECCHGPNQKQQFGPVLLLLLSCPTSQQQQMNCGPPCDTQCPVAFDVGVAQANDTLWLC